MCLEHGLRRRISGSTSTPPGRHVQSRGGSVPEAFRRWRAAQNGKKTGGPIHRRDDGGLTLEAPPEAAETLAALFEGMGRLLRQAADPREPAP